MSDGLIAMTFLEVESCSGKSVFDVVDDPISMKMYAFWMKGISLGR
jgi:hypothetical protein